MASGDLNFGMHTSVVSSLILSHLPSPMSMLSGDHALGYCSIIVVIALSDGGNKGHLLHGGTLGSDLLLK